MIRMTLWGWEKLLCEIIVTLKLVVTIQPSFIMQLIETVDYKFKMYLGLILQSEFDTSEHYWSDDNVVNVWKRTAI